jgi:peptidoglycan/LPS O-acetylase OafA/YrhL
MVHRVRKGMLYKMRFSNSATVLMLILVILLLSSSKTNAPEIFDLLVVLFIFPLLILVSTFIQPTKHFARISGTVGLASYGVYILQLSFLWVFIGPFVGRQNVSFWPVMMAVPLLFFIALVLDNVFDRPMRRWMKSRLFPASIVGASN